MWRDVLYMRVELTHTPSIFARNRAIDLLEDRILAILQYLELMQ